MRLQLVINLLFCVVQNQLQLTEAVAEVRQAISRLTVNPPDFSQVVVRLIDLFSTKVLDETTLAAIVEEIFVQVQILCLDCFAVAVLCWGYGGQAPKFLIGSVVISLSCCCLPNNEGPGPPNIFS